MHKLLRKIKKYFQYRSRNKKQDHFYSLFKKTDTVIDVGVGPEKPHSPKTDNYFIKTFRYDPKNYTGLGIESMEGMDKIYPGMKFVQYGGGTFPFDDNQFDWAYSNAVIEHVGSKEVKTEFIKEMCRVAKHVFFTTPNKYFPVDSHTLVFFRHWNDKHFYKWRQKHNKWLPKDTLNLVSIKELKRLLNDAGVKKYMIKRNRVLGMTMTFTVII